MLTRRPLFGWFLAVTGAVWFLAETHLLPAGVDAWWPLLIVILALAGIVRSVRDRRRQAFGAYLTSFLVAAYGLALVHGLVSERLFPPVLLLSLGLGLILRRMLPDPS
jgi:steroid 5-alpha reductase family enzyme